MNQNLANRKFLIFFLVILGCTMIFLGVNAASSRKDFQGTEREFAQVALEEYVKNTLNEKNFANFGFGSLGGAEEAKVGDPYEVMMIGLKDLKAYRQGTGAEPYLIDTNILWFPVISEGEIRTKLEIIEIEGEFIAGEFGGTRSVEVVAEVQDQLQEILKTNEIVPDNKPMMLRIPALQARFIYILSKQAEFFIPTMTYPEMYRLKNGQLYTADEVLEILSKIAQTIDEENLY